MAAGAFSPNDYRAALESARDALRALAEACGMGGDGGSYAKAESGPAAEAKGLAKKIRRKGERLKSISDSLASVSQGTGSGEASAVDDYASAAASYADAAAALEGDRGGHLSAASIARRCASADDEVTRLAREIRSGAWGSTGSANSFFKSGKKLADKMEGVADTLTTLRKNMIGWGDGGRSVDDEKRLAAAADDLVDRSDDLKKVLGMAKQALVGSMSNAAGDLRSSAAHGLRAGQYSLDGSSAPNADGSRRHASTSRRSSYGSSKYDSWGSPMALAKTVLSAGASKARQAGAVAGEAAQAAGAMAGAVGGAAGGVGKAALTAARARPEARRAKELADQYSALMGSMEGDDALLAAAYDLYAAETLIRDLAAEARGGARGTESDGAVMAPRDGWAWYAKAGDRAYVAGCCWEMGGTMGDGEAMPRRADDSYPAKAKAALGDLIDVAQRYESNFDANAVVAAAADYGDDATYVEAVVGVERSPRYWAKGSPCAWASDAGGEPQLIGGPYATLSEARAACEARIIADSA